MGVLASCTRLRRVLSFVALGVGVLGALPPRSMAQPSPTAIVERIRSTGGRPIDFHAAAFPDSVYVGQQITYQVAVLLSEQARSRLRRNPEFLPPELRGLLAYELGSPSRVAPRSYGGGVYEAHVFQRALFAVKSGRIQVPSPQLSYTLPQSASYFSREERAVVRAESVTVAVKPLPPEGRPANFDGAVGVYRAAVRFDSNTARVGDPLVLTVRIEGTGNVKLLSRPTLELSWASIVPGSERVSVDTSGALVRGSKEFDFIVTPRTAGRVSLPVVRYSYFDPYRREYAVAETSPTDVAVADGALAEEAPGEDGGALPLRTWPTAQGSAAWPSWLLPVLLACALLAPVPALVALAQRSRRHRRARARDTGLAVSRPSTPDDGTPGAGARRARRDLMARLANRLHVPAGDIVARRDVERVLRRRGVTRETTGAVLALLDELDMLGYGGKAHDGGAGGRESASLLAQRVQGVVERVDGEAVRHGRTALWSRRLSRARAMLWLAAVGAGVAMHAGAQPLRAQDRLVCPTEPSVASVTGPVAVRVREAVAAYEGRRYAAATERFAQAVAACPEDTDLLLNWGNAAWAAADTVSAVIAWQRAARREPMSADVQERLALLPAGARGGIADVPMVPVQLLVVGAVLAWMLAWVLLFVHWRAAHDTAGSAAGVGSAIVLVLLALGAGSMAWWGRARLDGRALAVVRRPETMRGAPGYEAVTMGGVATGDVVRLGDAQEGWFRVQHADGRTGWLPASRLTALRAPLQPSTGSR